MSRLLWWIITPRQLRRSGFIVLLAWLMVALGYQDGVIPRQTPVGQLTVITDTDVLDER